MATADRSGRRKLAPGIYVQGTTVHVYPEELCEHLGIPHTAENEELIHTWVRIVLNESFPGANIPVEEVYHE